MQITALTELDAVNTIIGTIGEAPIDSLEDMTDVDAINAYRILQTIDRQEQARGWSFNMIPSYTLTPEVYTKKIPWNDNILYLKDNHGHKLVRSGNYVLDLNRNSNIFETPIEVEIVLLMPFETLPEAMRSYIVAKASFNFQARYFGDDSLAKITQSEIQDAWQYLQEYEVENNNYSMYDLTYVKKLMQR